MKKVLGLFFTALLYVLLLYPLPDMPRLHKLLLYPTSALVIQQEYSESTTLPKQEYGSIQIGYDSLGIPSIYAENDLSAAWAMGYCQARDRLFQMEMLVRAVNGTLTEVVGEKALKSDMWWRKFRFEQKALEQIEDLKTRFPEEHAKLLAFSEGINAYINGMAPEELPFEYYLLDFKPFVHQPHYMYFVTRYMDKTLNYDEQDLGFSALPGFLPDSLIEFYYPHINPLAEAIYPNLKYNLAEITGVDNDRGEVPEVVYSEEEFSDAQIRTDAELDLGSNNWAVSPKKSATGNAFLCNDTHLSLRLPGTWYQMNVRIGDEIIAGFTVIGSPGIISGFTNHVAWGMTNATWDLVDFYELETNAAGQYLMDEEWIEMDRFEESFTIKGGGSIKKTYHESAFGPMDSLNDRYLAVQWVGMLTGTHEMLAFSYLQKAKNIEEAFEALEYFNHPPQNFILADSKGNIGLSTTGFAAIHPAPTRGITKANSIKDLPQYVQMNRWLHEFNPQRGWTGSANQNQVSDTLSAYLSTRFSPNSRGKRLKQMMEEKEKISREDLMAMHTDAKDLEWDLGKEHFLKVCKKEWLETMQAWNGVCDTNSVAATIYQEYRFELSKVMAAKLGDMKLTPQSEYLLYLVSNNELLPTSTGTVSAIEVAGEAIANVERNLSEQMGYDWKAWTYGKYHMTKVAHITGIPALSYPAFGSNGSGRTLLANSGVPSDHGPSMRTIIEFTPKGPVADMVLTGGQSGRVNSPNYSDQLTTWNTGKYYRVNIPATFEAQRYQCTYSSK